MRCRVALLIILSFVLSLSSSAQPSVENGRALLKDGKTRDAAAVFIKILNQTPRNKEAWVGLAEAYLMLDQPDSAAIACRRLLALESKRAEYYILLACAQAAMKKPFLVLETLNDGLLNIPENAQLLISLGQALLVVDSVDHAVVAFTQASVADPHSAIAYECLGDSYIKLGIARAAIIQYQKALDIDSLRLESRTKLAGAFLQDHQYNAAAQIYKSVLQIDSTNWSTYFQLGKLYAAARQHSNAVRYLKPYVTWKSDDRRALTLAIESYAALQQHREVITLSERLLELEPYSLIALRNVARARVKVREYDRAIEDYGKLAKLDSLQGDDWKELGMAYAESKRDSLAFDALQRSLSKDSSHSEVYNQLGVLYMRNRNYEQAAAMFEKRINLDSTAVGAYVNYALSHMALGHWSIAYIALRQTLNLRPHYLQGHLYIARTLLQMDSLKAARSEYDTVVQLIDTATTMYRTELAEAQGINGFDLLLQKKYPQAVSMLKSSVQLVENNYQTHLWYAQALALSNKRDEATVEYKIVLKLDPGNKDAKKGLEILGQ